MDTNLQSDDVYHRVNCDFRYQRRCVQQTIELSGKWLAINRVSVTLRQSMRSEREPNGERVVIAGPAASRRIIWRANRWKKTEPAPLSFFEQRTSRGKIRGDGQSISIATDTVTFDRWTIERNSMGWEWRSKLFSNGKGASCAPSTDSWQYTGSTRTITRTHAFFDHHEIACKIFAHRSDCLVDVISSLELTLDTIFDWTTKWIRFKFFKIV